MSMTITKSASAAIIQTATLTKTVISNTTETFSNRWQGWHPLLHFSASSSLSSRVACLDLHITSERRPFSRQFVSASSMMPHIVLLHPPPFSLSDAARERGHKSAKRSTTALSAIRASVVVVDDDDGEEKSLKDVKFYYLTESKKDTDHRIEPSSCVNANARTECRLLGRAESGSTRGNDSESYDGGCGHWQGRAAEPPQRLLFN